MELDIEYLAKLRTFISGKWRGHTKLVDEKVTTDKDKFIFHLKHYIDTKGLQEPDVTFNNDYTKFQVHGDRQGKPVFLLPLDFWVIKRLVVATPASSSDAGKSKRKSKSKNNEQPKIGF